MFLRRFAVLLPLAMAACTAPDAPASPERLGRFIGLVANCGCSDIGPERMLAEYPRAVSGRYSAADVSRMHGFIDVGTDEKFENQPLICAEVCTQTCAVNFVVLPLGGRPAGNGASCVPTEGGLHLTTGWIDAN